jgi:hypothetical protein
MRTHGISFASLPLLASLLPALFCGLSVAATTASAVAVWTWHTVTSPFLTRLFAPRGTCLLQLP